MKQNGHIGKNKKRSMKISTELNRLLETLQEKEKKFVYFIVFDRKLTLRKIFRDLKEHLGNKIWIYDPEKEKKSPGSLFEEHAEYPFWGIRQLEQWVERQIEKTSQKVLNTLEAELLEWGKTEKKMLVTVTVEGAELLQQHLPKLWGRSGGVFFFDESLSDRLRLAHLLWDHFADSYGCESFKQKQILLDLYQQAYQIVLKKKSEQGLVEFYLQGAIGRLYYKIGDYPQALQCFQKQKIQAEHLGDKKLIPEILNNLAIVHQANGEFEAALQYAQQGWALAGKCFRGEQHPVKAILLNNLGGVWADLGNPQEAHNCCRNARRIFEYKLGARHPMLVPSLIKLSQVFLMLEKHEEALDGYRYALQVVERRMSLNHPYIAVILHRIGGVYHSQGKHELAQRYLSRNMENIERCLGAEHPHLAAQLGMLGSIHYQQGDAKRALLYFIWAARMRRKFVGEKDPVLAEVLNHIGKVYLDREAFDNAYMYFKKALSIYRMHLPDNHPGVREVKNNILLLKERQLPTP